MTMRKCQGCQKIFDRKDMVKITRNHLTKELVINPDSKITGRSLYVCKNVQCLKAILKKKRIERNFKCVPEYKGTTLSDVIANLEDKLRL